MPNGPLWQLLATIAERRRARGEPTPLADRFLGPAQPPAAAPVPRPTPAPARTPPAAAASPAGSAAASSAGPSPQAAGGSYTVRNGDSLWNIAARVLGNGNLWRELAQLNGITNPDMIQPGQQLRLPGSTGAAGDTAPIPRPNPDRMPQPPAAPVRTNFRIPVPTIGPATVSAPSMYDTGIVPAPMNAGQPPPLLAEGAASGPQPSGPLVVPTSAANLSAMGMGPIGGMTRTPAYFGGGGVPMLPEGAEGGRMVPTSGVPLAQSIFAADVPELPMSPYPMFMPYGQRPRPRAMPPLLPGV